MRVQNYKGYDNSFWRVLIYVGQQDFSIDFKTREDAVMFIEDVMSEGGAILSGFLHYDSTWIPLGSISYMTISTNTVD